MNESLKPKARRKRNNYVTNAEFYDLLVKYKEKVNAAKALGQVKPRIPESIGKIFLQIATHYSEVHKFVGYPFRQDMISDATLVCVTYVDSFDPEKSKNPFAYFTRCCHFAFIRRIDLEKKELYTRFKLMRNMNVTQTNYDSQMGDTDSYDDMVSGESEQLYEYMNNFLENYTPSKAARKKAAEKEKTEGLNDDARDRDEDSDNEENATF